MKRLVCMVAVFVMLALSTAVRAEDVFFEIKADKPSYTPSSITVKKGDHVKLKITSTDVEHGIHLEAFGLKDTIIPEKSSVVLEFTADKTGTFSFPCTKYCSWRHLVGARPRLEIKVIE
ncbi:MAG: cupredoxin domain-containing protein [Deltaproteobacteria bacterium]|nr:cupredoxin domain-containing protein [Deltaproteobacteria bacterium]